MIKSFDSYSASEEIIKQFTQPFKADLPTILFLFLRKFTAKESGERDYE